ncbi:hypothetical protein [Nocardioides sp. LS1]|uniref:hypothetical protein n=1 Tax=Nocardioides sp. LS1 TaxID=1027620 RepID=UPI000F622C24|nr:hypothetical protein [Nocardioides sp. LS1]GCD90504.1 hypothetical protein NLS1_25100 [Nocardioides sp. LS1]
MHLLSRFVAVATLASTALAGVMLAPTGTAATPAGAPAIHRPAGSAQAPPVRVTVRITKDGVRRSMTGFRPGSTIFDMVSDGGTGTLEVIRLHDGYSLKEIQKDFGGLFSGDLKAIRRIDRNVEFYGGSSVTRHTRASFATHLDAGLYYLVNLDRGTWRTMRVTGKVQQRWMPVSHGPTNIVSPNRFDTPRRMAHSGWMRTTNKSDEPHFVDMNLVKWSTTPQQVKKFFEGGAKGHPSWGLGVSGGTLVIGPGHTVAWSYDLPRGKYVLDCFWPDDETGMPHALMGMWHLTRLR